MLGLQGKSAKPTARASSFSTKSNNDSGRGEGDMSTIPGRASSKLRASPVSSEKPVKLSRSRGSTNSPYNTKMSSGAGVARLSTRRVQSAANNRQGSALGPSVKASELFRKNSEPQLTKRGTNQYQRLTKDDGSTPPNQQPNKNVKHVRIELDTENDTLISNPIRSRNRFSNNGNFLRQQTQGSVEGYESEQRTKRPFSFSSDKSRSVSMTSVNSNDSPSSDHDLNPAELRFAGGDASVSAQWKNDNDLNTMGSRTGKSAHPRLSKRTHSMDSTFFENVPGDTTYQLMEMKIHEHPEETLKEENYIRIGSGGTERRSFDKSFSEELSFSSRRNRDLNKTFVEEPSNDRGDETCSGVSGRRSNEYDRLLLQHSDKILEGVSDLIDEIKASESSGNQQMISSADSIENLVAELKSDMNSSTFALSDIKEAPMMYESRTGFGVSDKLIPNPNSTSTSEDRFNLNCLDLSGIELADISCPQDVMDQSVPNSSRMEGSVSEPVNLAEVFLGNSNNNKTFSLSEEVEKYRLANNSTVSVRATKSNDNNDGFESSDSNNQTFSRSDALSSIQKIRRNSNNSNNDVEEGDGDTSPSIPVSDFEVDPEEIQQKICSALKMLEEEDKKVRRRERGYSGRFSQASGRSTSPGSLPVNSNSDSRIDSRGDVRREMGHFSPSSRKQRQVRSDRRCEKKHETCGRGDDDDDDDDEWRYGPRSARSCSCILEHRQTEADTINSARSSKTIESCYPMTPRSSINFGKLFERKNDIVRNSAQMHPQQLQKYSSQGSLSTAEGIGETKSDKTKQIFTFLDEVEKTDQEVLFGLRFEKDDLGRPKGSSPSVSGREALGRKSQDVYAKHSPAKEFRTMDTLIRKGSVELAREILLQERKLDEAQHAVKLLEESLLNQRELNVRNLRNSERDFKKRMKLQKEEFELAFSRNEALINEMAAEKRVLQEKLDKIIKNFEEMEEKHKEQTKSLQQKHLDEIRRLRKMQQNTENTLKQKLAGNKAQAHEIREMTVKGLEPEVQRIIQRHQQEMSEMRAWHADEIREMEERTQRKLHMQLEDMREKLGKEKEDAIMREREIANRRLDAEMRQKDDEVETVKRRFTNEIFEERERAVSEELKLKESMQESVRKAELKGEVERDNLKKEYETKLNTLEHRHENELKSVKDVYEAERQNWMLNQTKRTENALSEQEVKLRDTLKAETERDWKEKEKKLKEEFEKTRKDDESSSESRFRRMQEKLQTELIEMENIEKDVKTKLTQAKSELLTKEEELFSLKASVTMKDKQLVDLQENNMKMQEERVNLTSVIRREFANQIQTIEEECRSLKASIVEIQSSAKLQVEQKQLEIEKVIAEKDAEIEKIGLRVKQALGRKDETILELQKQLEKCSFQINHLEELLEEQRKELLHSVKMPGPKKNK